MEKRRQPGLYIAGAVVVLALIAWLVVAQTNKHRLITELGNRNLQARLPAVKALLDAEKLDDALPGLPVYKRSYVAQALGEIHTAEATRVLGILLKDQEEAPSRWAGEALVKQGVRALPILMAAMSAGGGTKDNAVKALQALGPEAAPRLRFLLNDRGPYGNAAEALGKINGVGTAALVRGSYSLDDKLRQACLAQLAAAKRHEALQACIDNLDAKKDKLAQVDTAIKALGTLGDPAAAPALLSFLTTGKRSAAAASLGLLKNPIATEPMLAQVVAGGEGYDETAALALSRIGAPAVPALMQELKSPAVAMRRVAASALSGSDSPQATGALIAALSDGDSQVRASAATALGWNGNTAATAALVGALKDPNWRVVDAAAEALGEVGPSAIASLLAVAGAPGQDVTVSYQVSRALAAMGRKAIPSLLTALSSPNPGIQQWAAVALGTIGDQRAVPALRKLEQASAGRVKWEAGEQLRVLAGTAAY